MKAGGTGGANTGTGLLFEKATSLDLAEARKRLENGQHLGLADHFVVRGGVKDLLERDRPHLQTVFQLGARTAYFGRLFESGHAGFGRQCGRK